MRATCVDAISYGFNAAVLEDGTADRIEASHKVAPLDIWMKYADVMTCQEATAYLQDIATRRNRVAAAPAR